MQAGTSYAAALLEDRAAFEALHTARNLTERLELTARWLRAEAKTADALALVDRVH